MSYTELEHGYQDLRSTSRPIFYVGDINTAQPSHVDPTASSLYRSSKRGELSDGCSNEDGCMGGSDLEGEGKQVLVGICAMAKKSQSKPMKEILTRLEEFEYIKILVFPEEVILKEPVEDWPIVDCLISFHSKGFPLDKAIHYANLRNPFNINNLPMQYDIQDRRRVYAILDSEGIEIPRYAVLDRDSADPKHHELVESEDHVEVNGVTFNKPFVEKPVSAEDHNIYIYYPTSAGGGSQRLFRKIGSRSSVYSPESRVRKTGSYIYEDFMPTDGTDVKVYTVGPDYAHAEARKSPALDGKVERDSEGKEIRYPVILSNAEKLISRKVCLAFKQTVCGFDLLRANGKSFVCDVNGFSFVKNSNKYYDDSAKILGNMILRELAPTLHIPWSVPFQLDDPPIVPTTFGKMMELRCVVAVIRHGDRTPKQKMKVEVRHPKFFEIFAKYDGYKHGHVKLKRPKQLQEILDTARSLLTEIQHRAAGPELEEKQGKLEQLKSVLEMYGHFSGINRKVQMKYQPRGRPRGSSSDDGNSHNRLGEPSLVLILKWGGELTPAGRIQAEELGRIFRCMYPGGQGRHLSEEDSEMLPSHGEYAGAQGLGLLRLHSTFRHDLKIYASDEGRVQMTAAAFAKGLLALEGELTPILVQMVKSANTNGLLDNDCDSSKYQNMVKTRLHELLQQDREFTREDREQINPGNALSINDALDFVKNPVKCCQHVQALIQKLMDIVRIKKDDPKTKDAILYHGETWELMGRRWGKIEKDFCTKHKRFDISKIPDIYDCIKYDLQHNNHTLQFDHAEELYIYAKYLADIVIPQEYGLTVQEKLTIGQGICTPLLKKIRADLQRNIEESGEETVNRLNPRYSHGVSSPGRHVRTRLYFTSESHVHSLLTVLRYGGLLDVVTDEQWRRAMEYVSMVSELNYMSQIVVMLYEDPTKDPSSEERFHVELHFSPGVNCCVQKNLPPGPGFRPHSRNESSHNLETTSQCSTRIEEEDAELGVLDDDATISPQQQSESSPPLIETEEAADSTLDSPTTSRAIDMMDLDPNMMDEPYDSGFLQGSAPIPISARTVAGHEAARLGSQLAASQRQRREREASSICEPRARSYDHQRQEKPEKTADKLQYQSLDAVNKEGNRPSRRFDFDDLFYERVENVAVGGSQSSRNNVHKNSSSCRDISSNVSLYASSPDLLDSLAKASDKYSLSHNTPNANRSKMQIEKLVKSPQELSINEDNDSWDFGESQLLEKSPVSQKNEFPGEGIILKGDAKIFGLPTNSHIGKTDRTRVFPSTRSAGNDLVQSKAVSQFLESLSAENNPVPLSKNVLRLKSKTSPKDVPLDLKVELRNVEEIVSSSDDQLSYEIKARDLNEMTSIRNFPLHHTSELQDPVEISQSRAYIERKKSREIPNAKVPPTERNRVMTCSPSYLGIPVALPHSVSSPELPAPVIETILQSSGPLVTLHNKSLASPTVQSPPRPSSIGRPDRTDKILLTSYLPTRQICNLMPLALQTSETKRYGRSKSALTLPTVNDARGEFGSWVPEIMSTKSSPSNTRLPIDMSNCSPFCHHCEASKLMRHEGYDANTTRSESIKPKAKNSITNSLSQSNSRRASPTAPEICHGSEVGLEIASPVSTYPPTNDCLPIDISNCPPSLCYHCKTSNLMDHECYDSKTSRYSIAMPLSQPNSRRASLNVPKTWDEGVTSPETVPNEPSPILAYSHQHLTSSLHTYRTIKSSSNPNSRRTSLTIIESGDRARSLSPCRYCERKSQYKCSTSLTSGTHSYCRRASAVEVSTYGASERFHTDSNSRRRSLTVPANQDLEALGENEDFLKRQNRSSVGRSRSLSPYLQRCLCYNCNVAALIQESVNLSLAERLNFQTYFARSLSHKFSNCTCYKRSLESAKALRRISRSASPNSTSSHEFVLLNNTRSPPGPSVPYFDDWQDRKSRNNRTSSRDSCVHQIADDNSLNLTSLCSHHRAIEHGKRSERRQSSPQDTDSSSQHSCGRCRLYNDFVSAACSSQACQKEKNYDFCNRNESASSRVRELDSLRTVEKSNNVIPVDSLSPIGQSESVQDKISDSSDSSFPNVISDGTVGYSISVDESTTVGYEKPCNLDTVVGSNKIGQIHLESNEDTSEIKSTYSSSLPFSSNIVPVNNQSFIDGQVIHDNIEPPCSISSGQLSCPEVVIDTCSANPLEYSIAVDCHCNNCISGDDDDNPYRMNKSKGLLTSSPASLSALSSTDFLNPEQINDHRKLERSLPRQFSCPEIISESPDRSIPSQRKDIITFRRSSIRQHCSDADSESSTNLIGLDRRHVGKSRFSLDSQFLYLTNNNDNSKRNNLDNRTLGLQRFRKMGFLPRQFSCPEIIGNFIAPSSYSFSHQHTHKSMTTSCCDEPYCLKPLNSSLSACCSRYHHSSMENYQSALGPRYKDAIPYCSYLNYDASYDSENNLMAFPARKKTHTNTYKLISTEINGTMYTSQRYKSSASSLSSHPRLQTQRSFSSPDTRPSIIQEPDPTCTARRHRHSISGQMSYFKLLGYNVSKKLTGSANSLFSTAVISGSSSAPNLKDMVPPHASVVAAIEGFGGVPPIRPLETLHNALSLRQLDSFLDMMTSAPLFRTPASSPPKFPSPGGSIHGGSVVSNLNIGGINREYHSSDLEAVRYITPTPIHYKQGQDGEGNDLRNQLSPTSPNSTGWSSEAQSFLSSEPSSPAPTSAGECSMSMSLVSNDGTQPFAGPKFSTTPCLNLDFNDFCMSIDQDTRGESRGSISYTDYYSNEDGLIRKTGPDLTHLRERATRDETPQESVVDEDEEHTLTLRQTEEQRKQDVKFIFDQNKESSSNLVKPGSSYKKIGRFRVESMEIADKDVTIKEAAAAAAAAATSAVFSSSSNLFLDQTKGASTSVQDKSAFGCERVTQDIKKSKGGFSTPQPRSGHRGKLIARSQSVSTPQNVCHIIDVDYASQAASNKTGSFSTMSCEDLENWKATAVSPPASTVISPSEAVQEEPILTLASSLKGTSNITVGFNVQQDKKD